MRDVCIKIYAYALGHKGLTLGIGALAAVAAVKVGAHEYTYHVG